MSIDEEHVFKAQDGEIIIEPEDGNICIKVSNNEFLEAAFVTLSREQLEEFIDYLHQLCS